MSTPASPSSPELEVRPAVWPLIAVVAVCFGGVTALGIATGGLWWPVTGLFTIAFCGLNLWRPQRFQLFADPPALREEWLWWQTTIPLAGVERVERTVFGLEFVAADRAITLPLKRLGEDGARLLARIEELSPRAGDATPLRGEPSS